MDLRNVVRVLFITSTLMVAYMLNVTTFYIAILVYLIGIGTIVALHYIEPYTEKVLKSNED